MPSKTLMRIGAAGCVAVLMTGCGSSATPATGTGHGSTVPTGSASMTPTPTATESATHPAASPATLASLKKIVLQRADMPSTWTATPYKADSGDAGDQAALARCVGMRNTDKDKVAEANSDDFAQGDATISSSASSYRSQSDLDADIASLRNPKMSSCLEHMFTTRLGGSLPHGAKITGASVKITPSSGGGAANLAGTGSGTITVSISGQTVTVYLAVAFITGPLIEAEVDAENVNAPVPDDVFQTAATTVAARAARG
jgi:hypothetical protein